MRKKEIEDELKAIDFYLRHHKEDMLNSENMLMSSSPYHDLLQSNFCPISQKLAEWSSCDYETNLKYYEERNHRTTMGILVRSKSEAMIVFFLNIYKIPFHYEEKIIIGDVTLYPDFTIRHPETGEYYYWEHFGMMDDEAYVKNAISKLQLYSLNGIVPGVSLITTFETKKHPLSMEWIRTIVEYYFQ